MNTNPYLAQTCVFHEAFIPNAPHTAKAAIICHVFDDSLVNLCIFDSDGFIHTKMEVRFRKVGEEAPMGMFCESSESYRDLIFGDDGPKKAG